VTASCLVFFSGTCDAFLVDAMRDYDEEDPKKPRPVTSARKGDNALEAQEYGVGPGRKDNDRDRHRHVHRC
jgi:hypothetical protein